MEKLVAYNIGIVAASVCVDKDLTKEQIEEEMNSLHPTGISSNWQISESKTFKTGEDNPCRCNTDINRLHYLLEC